MTRALLQATTAWVVAGLLINPVLVAAPALAAGPVTGPYNEPTLTPALATGTAGTQYASNPAAQGGLTLKQKITLLRQKVKYVFVLFQENRSFDAYFGTYPGVNGYFATYPGANPNDPYAQPAVVQPSYSSVIIDTNGQTTTVSPFLLPRTYQTNTNQTLQIWPEDTYSVDHSHAGYINDFHVDAATKAVPKNDGYPLDNEGYYYATDASGLSASIDSKTTNAPPTTPPTLQAKQKGEMVMSHIDCDTIPFLWQYADRFALFDNFHQTATGPSTPNAIAMIAGQVGDTQWVKHGSVGYPSDGKTPSLSVPNLTDNGPFPGNAADTSPVKPPYGPDETSMANSDTNGNFAVGSYPPNTNLTFASLPLSFMGHQAQHITGSDENPLADLADVQQDILRVGMDNKMVDWGWYQQGYGPEPFDGQQVAENGDAIHFTNAPIHASYIVHHNGPQYFGYVGDNPEVTRHLHGLQKFYSDIKAGRLDPKGGVFYVRGGYYNNDHMVPADPNATVQLSTPGNDDHPNYSDAGISEALIADNINAIAKSPYWAESAIIVTYDETDGLYDHQPEQFRTWGPDGLPETGGPRIPAIVISPYAASHVVSHVYSEHSSVIRFINELFGLIPLSDLPDEVSARNAGAGNPAFNAPNGQAQQNLGPADNPAKLKNYEAGMGNLLEAFDDQRLTGKLAPLSADYAMIPPGMVHAKLPHYLHQGTDGQPAYGCQFLGITPTDYIAGQYAQGAEIDPPPQDFNPRPTQSPGEPYLNINNNTATDPQAASTGPWDPPAP